MIITLLGYMASGKSHLARILSQELNLPHFDLDAYLVRQEGRSITQIFEQRGEIYFRRREHEALQELLHRDEDLVLSLGGGTPAYYHNMELVNQRSTSFYLHVPIPDLVQRLQANGSRRPLIAHLGPEELTEYVAKHVMERNPYYQLAHHTIFTQSKTDVQIVEEINLHLQDDLHP